MTEGKEVKSSQTYESGLIASHTVDSLPVTHKSARRAMMQRFGLAFLASALILGATSFASASENGNEAAVRALGNNFAKAFVQKNARLRASLFAEDGTFLTPTGDFLQGRVAMVREFGPEAQQAVTPSTQAVFSNYRVHFIRPDVAVVDALLTVHNVTGPDGKLIATVPINFFYVAVRHSDRWQIEDGRAHFAPAPSNAMSARK